MFANFLEINNQLSLEKNGCMKKRIFAIDTVDPFCQHELKDGMWHLGHIIRSIHVSSFKQNEPIFLEPIERRFIFL